MLGSALLLDYLKTFYNEEANQFLKRIMAAKINFDAV